MPRARLIVIVPAITDEDAVKLKRQIEKLIEDKAGAQVSLSLEPVREFPGR